MRGAPLLQVRQAADRGREADQLVVAAVHQDGPLREAQRPQLPLLQPDKVDLGLMSPVSSADEAQHRQAAVSQDDEAGSGPGLLLPLCDGPFLRSALLPAEAVAHPPGLAQTRPVFGSSARVAGLFFDQQPSLLHASAASALARLCDGMACSIAQCGTLPSLAQPRQCQPRPGEACTRPER